MLAPEFQTDKEKQTTNMAQKTTYRNLNLMIAAGGFKPDEGLGIDRVFVEGYTCDRCRRNLVYKNYRNERESVCYGVCRACDFAREFFFNSPVIAAGKRRFSKAG